MEHEGLTHSEAKNRLEKNGPNQLPEKAAVSDAQIFFRQFASPLIYILIIAAAISFFLGDSTDALVIMLAVVVNTVLGFYQERKAEKGLAALKRILTPQARVVREGNIVDIDARELVVGDVVVLSAGDKVPADGVLRSASELTINEAILTGESVSVYKTGTQHALDSTSIDNQHRVFMGTTVVTGLGRFVITATGKQTEIGKIATSLSEAPEKATPLQKRLSQLAKQLTIIVVIAAAIIFITGALRGEPWVEIFTTSVAVAVAAIPEGLVIALTAILALGMQRILARKALVRKLVVAETLGTVTVIATDKTGTLTEGKLKVVATHFSKQQEGLKAAAIANQLIDPLERAMWEWLSAQPKFDPQEVQALNHTDLIIPFDAKKKFSATVVENTIYVLGAPEVLVQMSEMTGREKAHVMAEIEDWAQKGLRIIGVGYKPKTDKIAKELLKKHHEIKQLTFLGLVGFADPVRVGVKDALALCQEAGISVKVVTGDYRWTAEAVLRQVGIKLRQPEKQILDGEELAHLEADELASRIKDIILFARVSPNQKMVIVEALKKQGEVVALLGDGVNDAPALKRADIGIVVGEASDVARETADLVLLDANFSTIVAAVEEGRSIFVNLQKVMTYLLGDTFAEVSLILLGLAFGVPLPMTAAQILWVNLVTDTLPTLALTLETKERHLLKRSPIAPDLPLLDKGIGIFMGTASLASGIVIFAAFLYFYRMSGDVEMARLIAFTAFSLKSLVYVFSLRDQRRLLWQTSLFSNKWLWIAVAAAFGLLMSGLYVPALQKILMTRQLTLIEWGIVIGCSLMILAIIESIKIIRFGYSRIKATHK